MKKNLPCAFLLVALLAAPVYLLTSPVIAAPPMVIYDDQLASGWLDGSWDADVNYANTNPTHNGTNSISVTYTDGWGGLQIMVPSLYTAGYDDLRFFIHGGSTGGQAIRLLAVFSDGSSTKISLSAPLPNQWHETKIPLSTLQATNRIIIAFIWQLAADSIQPTFYLDDIALVSNTDLNAPILVDASLHPRSIPADGKTETVVRVHASDPQGNDDIVSVTVDATAIGRGIVTLRDDGLSNDGAAGDGLYAALLTVAPGTPSGEMMVVVTACDTSHHSATLAVAVLVILSPLNTVIPDQLVQQFGWGTNAWTGSPEETDWQFNTGIPFSYLDQYITHDWESWGDTFVQDYVNYAWNRNYTPVLTIYVINGLPTFCGETPECYLDKLSNANTVNAFFSIVESAASQAIGDKAVIFNLEPDFYGYMHYYTIVHDGQNGVVKDDPSSLPVALNRPGYSNTLAGFGRYLVDQIHQLAPNALVAPMASMWATNQSPNEVPVDQAILIAQRTANFMNIMGGAQADMFVVEWANADAAYPNIGVWWDDSDLALPRHNRALLWENALSTASGKRLLLWQVPMGNMALDNTPGHYKDNRAAYAFNHTRDLFDAGVVGLVFGNDFDGATQVYTDGDYIKGQAKVAYDPPGMPSGLEQMSITGLTVRLHWSENSEPDLWGYEVMYQPQSSGSVITVDTRRCSSLELTMPFGGIWKVQVRAYDAMGNRSPLSETLTVTFPIEVNYTFLPAILK